MSNDADTPALAMVRRFFDSADFEYCHNHGWSNPIVDGRSKAGWVFDVREQGGWRTYSVTVESGFVRDAEIDEALLREQREGG